MFPESAEQKARPKIKICGITNEADAVAAVECGVDALGFNFFPGSRRYIEIKTAAGWIEKLPDAIIKVAVLVDPNFEEAKEIAALPFISGLQLHGHETAEFCARIAAAGIVFAKALPVQDRDSLAALPDYSTGIVVLDSSRAGEFGGSGRIFDWEIAKHFIEKNPALRVVLAGGLTPDNVAEAIRLTRPFGVDVTTGVESFPGRKDWDRMCDFVAAVHAA